MLENLRLRNVRNYETAELDFCPGVNVLYGQNGQGKTGILEAIHYLCLTRSFRTADDRHVLRFNADYFEIEGRFVRSQSSLETDRHSLVARIAFQPGAGKVLQVNGGRMDRFSEWIGRLPVVISAPEDVAIVSGSSGDRRRWLDIVLSQIHTLYLKDLQDYRHCLRQRNAILTMDHPDLAALRPWDELLIQCGARIVRQRRDFLQTFAAVVEEVYACLVPEGEDVRLEYQTTIGDCAGDPDLVDTFRGTLEDSRLRDLQRQTSLVGPHRDEVECRLNDHPVRTSGSQGQYKTLAVALKFAEYVYLQREANRTPLLLLDDVFSELDTLRREKLVAYLTDGGQVFMTMAEAPPDFLQHKEIRSFRIHAGQASA